MLDFKPTVRSLAKAPGFTLLVVAVLAIGLGANAAMFTLIDRLLLHPLPYRDLSRMVEIRGHDRQGRQRGVSHASFVAWQDRVPSLDAVGLSKWRDLMLTGVDEPENLLALEVSSRAFDILGVPPLLGRLFETGDFSSGAAPVVLLSHETWQKQFHGDRSIVGRQILLDGAGRSVIGVMPAGFSFTNPLYRAWIPMERFKDANGELHRSFSAMARLRPGTTIEKAQHDLAAAVSTLPADIAGDDGWTPEVLPYTEQFVAGERRSLLILWCAVGAVLLIACANAANLLLARAAARRREFAIRASLGAGSARLIRQVFTESLLLGLAGGIAGVAFAAGLLPLTALFLPKLGLLSETTLKLTPLSLLVTLAAALFTALLCAVPTAFDLLRTNLLQPLGASSRSAAPGSASARLRSFLIAAEVALSIVLLIGAGLMIRSLSRLLDLRRLGLETQNVLTAKLSAPATLKKAPEVSQYYQRMLDTVAAVPGVRHAATVTILPFSNLMVSTSFSAEGAHDFNWRENPVNLRAVSPDYFQALGVRIVRGRAFDASDTPQSPKVAIINQELAKRCWPGQDPIGRRVSRESNRDDIMWYTVVGVVENTARGEIDGPPQAELYRPFTQDATAARATSLVIRTAVDPMSVAPSVSRAVHAVNPDQPVTDFKTMAAWINSSASRPRLQTFLLEVFAALALLLASSGVYAVVSYFVSQRTQEIGIRGALGATAVDIVAFVIRSGMAPVVAGMMVGLAASVALAVFLRAEFFETPPADPLVYGSVMLILLCVALAAMWIPARKAAAVQPAITLRE